MIMKPKNHWKFSEKLENFPQNTKKKFPVEGGFQRSDKKVIVKFFVTGRYFGYTPPPHSRALVLTLFHPSAVSE